MQKNQQGGQPSQGGKDQQSQQSGSQPQQGGGQQGRQTPNGGSSQQSQSGGGRGQQGDSLKSDPGQAQSRDAQQGNDNGNRSNKQR